MHHLDGLNVWAGNMLNESMVRQVHDAGLLLYCWTVDDMQRAAKLMDWGIDAITTNRAESMKEKLSLSK
jgi:glycerophosphoryl diester phosphodiesterase